MLGRTAAFYIISKKNSDFGVGGNGKKLLTNFIVFVIHKYINLEVNLYISDN